MQEINLIFRNFVGKFSSRNCYSFFRMSIYWRQFTFLSVLCRTPGSSCIPILSKILWLATSFKRYWWNCLGFPTPKVLRWTLRREEGFSIQPDNFAPKIKIAVNLFPFKHDLISTMHFLQKILHTFVLTRGTPSNSWRAFSVSCFRCFLICSTKSNRLIMASVIE
jgi:hypothetical protein